VYSSRSARCTLPWNKFLSRSERTTTGPMASQIQVFDPNQDYAVTERRLPHWSQTGTISFLTWRTWDSLPASVLRLWTADRDAWLKRHGIDPSANDWAAKLHVLGLAALREYKLHISDRWNDHLDECHGACVLRQSELAKIVADSLIFFNRDRYELSDFVIMPNHVHALVAFPDEITMLRQCESWKHFTASKINRALGRNGRFWQQDGFDHLVRSTEQFDYLQSYIENNPKRANLPTGEYVHWKV
jgi:putative transposase